MLILKIIGGAVAAVSAAQGAEWAFRVWMAWNSRRIEAEANGLPFYDPPPSEWYGKSAPVRSGRGTCQAVHVMKPEIASSPPFVDPPPPAAELPTLRRGLETARKALSAAGVPDSGIEAEALLRFVLGWERPRFLSEVYAGDARLAHAQHERLRTLLARRLGGEPLAYIVGAREFYGLNLRVDERVLIPRQETELLVDIALDRIGASPASCPLAIDVGTGSGAIALALAANSRAARIVATDVSADALAVARRNAAALGLADRIGFVRCDTLDAAKTAADLIVSNPPYIPSADMANLQAEIKREPPLALYGGADGLDPFRRLARGAARALAPGGALIVELMPCQMDAAESIARASIPRASRISRREDLFGHDRALIVETDAADRA